MAIIMIDLGNGTSIAKLDANGYAECDYICQDCIAYGRCKQQLELEHYVREQWHTEEDVYDERETTSPDNAEVRGNMVFVDDEFVGLRCQNHECPHFDLVEFDNSYGQPCGFQGCERRTCDPSAKNEERHIIGNNLVACEAFEPPF